MTNSGWKRMVVTMAPFALLILLLLARVACVYTWRIDSDEPQHLHVIWGWANGLLQYRDIFDNHAPLFHLMYVPVYAAFGERPDILNIMRLATIPLYLTALWAVYLIGRELYSRQIGLWSALIAGLYPKFFLTSLEFRADDLWIVPWLLALAVLVREQLRLPHLFLAGMLLGIGLSASMKTSFLLMALALAALIIMLLQHKSVRKPFSHYVVGAAAMVAGMALVPLMLIVYFYADGALAKMYYAVIQHNIVPSLGHWKHLGHTLFTLLWMVPMIIVMTWLLQRTCIDANRRQRRTLIFLTFSMALLWLNGFWPLITRQDFLPLIPLAVVVAAGELKQLFASGGYPIAEQQFRYAAVMLMLAGLELGLVVAKQHGKMHEPILEFPLLTETLQLTHPGEAIMDLKGETIFRPRPFYYVLEGVTRKRMELGMIQDSIPEDIVRTRTTVAGPDSDYLPGRGRQFINQNFIPVGQLRVAGQWLKSQEGEVTFDIRIPASYALVAEQGSVNGLLDGAPYVGPRQLAAGRHVFRPVALADGRLAVIWSPAIKRGFSPFVVHRAS